LFAQPNWRKPPWMKKRTGQPEDEGGLFFIVLGIQMFNCRQSSSVGGGSNVKTSHVGWGQFLLPWSTRLGLVIGPYLKSGGKGCGFRNLKLPVGG
jgi:hypothetical protein